MNNFFFDFANPFLCGEHNTININLKNIQTKFFFYIEWLDFIILFFRDNHWFGHIEPVFLSDSILLILYILVTVNES